MFNCNELFKKQFKINESIYLLRIYKYDHTKKPYISLVCRFGNTFISNNLKAIINFINDSQFEDKYKIEQAIFEYMS
jgi:hypothetical protein